ncbi:MAG: thioredoxin-disulfide reductase [Clostridium sp.]|uniref:thioredoxin-disulfide reductase n=1 Tax=Clostridium sp. DSM 8431 TaxID=1761781 RepID=UPI0008EC9644|nr:thioredoxin-disulfide reductase [Clostridium sp. DSM 8431]MCR4943620.1 thioredoxin-disulfide reductase [Clostridium sp.]SFU47669.1 thioredoxin reductase (NADPH) [Clostridium sp. DSM 8431]
MVNKEIKNLDLVILGAGPAGLTAAIYASRAKLNMIVLENAFPGGQVRNTYIVENYPGFKHTTGAELADKMQEQAEYVGAVIDEFDPVVNISLTEEEKIIETESYIYKPKAVILATGSVPKKLPVNNEAKFAGKGVHYCAVCDGAMYTDKVVGVVGGGNAALEEAIFLSRFAKKVYSIRRADSFNGEKSLFEEAVNNEKIEILYNTDVVSFEGNDFLEKVILQDTITGEKREINMDGVFGSIGTEPKTTDISKYINVNEYGYILTNELMETNVPGVFAAGDVREKPYRQITTAVADGTVAALAAERYIK